MSKNIFLLRIKQIVRYLTELGILRSVFVFGVIVYLLNYLLFINAKAGHSWIVIGFFISIVILFQLLRDDKLFFKENNYNYYPLFAIEYLILSLPLFVILLLWSQFTLIFLLFAFVLIVPFLTLSIKLFNQSDLGRSIHQNLSLFLFIYPFSVLFFQEPMIVLFSAFACSILLSNTSDVSIKSENGVLNEMPNKQIVNYLLFSKTKSILTLLLPISIPFLIFNFQYFLAFIYFVLASILFQSLSALIRLKKFKNKKTSAFIIALSAVACYLPWACLWGIIWFVILYFKRSKELVIQ